jgi:hypothetical protein
VRGLELKAVQKMSIAENRNAKALLFQRKIKIILDNFG